MTGVRSWSGVLSSLLAGRSLESADTAWAMNEIMSGEATAAQVAGFAVALRAKGVAPQELAGMAAAMLDHAEPITVTDRAVDLVGTGGDGAHTVNISTMGAVVAAGAGARVVKHGNRAASSSCGAADLLDELGVSIDLLGTAVARCVAEVGIGFCFAPRFHPALRHAAGPRRELGIPTPFNFLGPVTNPAQPPAMAVGCADAAMAEVIARVLADRGADGLVFRGEDGLDELSVAAPSRVWWVRGGTVEAGRIDPAELGITRSALDALRGGDAAYNAKVARAVFAGERGAVRDAVILNAAAAIAAYEGTADPDGLRAGLARAAESIDTGAAAGVLDRWVALCGTL